MAAWLVMLSPLYAQRQHEDLRHKVAVSAELVFNLWALSAATMLLTARFVMSAEAPVSCASLAPCDERLEIQ